MMMPNTAIIFPMICVAGVLLFAGIFIYVICEPKDPVKSRRLCSGLKDIVKCNKL